jgi:hypothetical protein
MTTVALPRITEKTIKARVGEQGLAKGRPYAHNGSVFDTKREGAVLRARVQGQMAVPYRLSVSLDESGVRNAECSCPVGGGGYCKHVAAVLLVFKEDPAAFVEVENIDVVLHRWCKEELITLVHQMLRRAPELEILLETPLPGTRLGKDLPVTPDVYRRQAETAFRLAGDDWRASYGVASDLEAIKALGDAFLKEGNAEAASAVYEGVLLGIRGEIESIQDEEGEIANVAVACCEGLGECLHHVRHPERRRAILSALFECYRDDVDMGGIGLGDEVPGLIVEQATADEKREVAGLVREFLTEVGGGETGWYTRRSLGAFLLDLEADILDDEGFLRVCRETGRKVDLVERLLELGRVKEARAEVETSTDHERIEFADMFLKHGQPDLADVLVRDMLGKGPGDVRALQWLKRRAQTRKDRKAALEMSQRLFQANSSLENYKELRKAAGKSAWPAVRVKTLEQLDPRRDGHTMIQIALEEGDVDRAIELVRSARPGFFGPLKLEVAAAAEAKRPDAALDIYKEQAERLVEQQGRSNYQSACTLLERIRAVYRKQKDGPGWDRYREDLLKRFHRLSALKDEMKRAKL